MVLVNTTTYESIKGRRWVDNSTNGRPFYVRYPLNCFRFFFRPGGAAESASVFGSYGRVTTQVRHCFVALDNYSPYTMFACSFGFVIRGGRFSDQSTLQFPKANKAVSRSWV